MVMCSIIGAPPASVVWTGSAGTASPSASHTFTSVSIGAANSTRNVFVATYFDAATAVVVNGVSASAVASATGNTLILWRAAVPTGTSVSITVTSASAGRKLIQVWAAYNLQSTTPFGTASYTAGANATTHTTTINRPANGVLIAAGGATGSTSLSVTSWSGATLDNNRLVTVSTVGILLSGASTSGTTAATGANLSSTWNASILAQMVGATYV